MPIDGRPMTCLFRVSGDAIDYVRAGSAFKRIRGDRITETAEIFAVYSDASGIPHFRFHVVTECKFQPTERLGPRVLAARAFFEQYRDRVLEIPVPTA